MAPEVRGGPRGQGGGGREEALPSLSTPRRARPRRASPSAAPPPPPVDAPSLVASPWGARRPGEWGAAGGRRPEAHPHRDAPSLAKKQAFFRGDAPQLLDRLVAACQQKTVNAPLPGYGRELEPVSCDWLMGADCTAASAPLEGGAARCVAPASPSSLSRPRC